MRTLTLATARAIQLSADTDLAYGWGSCFLCSHENRYFLVTNHHVISGRHPETGELLNQKGAFPGKLRVSCWGMQNPEADLNGLVGLEFTLSLSDPDGNPRWYEHPALGSSCDVVALPIPQGVVDTMPANAVLMHFELDNELAHHPEIAVMDELFIVGYPLKQSEALSKHAIYKAGFLASEPEDQHNGPRFYLDAKTKPGMSGGPVVHKQRLKVGPANGQGAMSFSEGKISLVGIYSGRAEYRPDEYQAELGIVWPIKDFLLPILDSALATVEPLRNPKFKIV